MLNPLYNLELTQDTIKTKDKLGLAQANTKDNLGFNHGNLNFKDNLGLTQGFYKYQGSPRVD